MYYQSANYLNHQSFNIPSNDYTEALDYAIAKIEIITDQVFIPDLSGIKNWDPHAPYEIKQQLLNQKKLHWIQNHHYTIDLITNS